MTIWLKTSWRQVKHIRLQEHSTFKLFAHQILLDRHSLTCKVLFCLDLSAIRDDMKIHRSINVALSKCDLFSKARYNDCEHY